MERHRSVDAAAVVGRADHALDASGDPRARARQRRTGGQHVDGPAERVAPVLDRGRPTQHLQAVHDRWADPGEELRRTRTEARGVEAHPVDQIQNPLSAQAADERRAVRRGRLLQQHGRLVAQHLREDLTGSCLELHRRHQTDRFRDVERRLSRPTRRGHHDLGLEGDIKRKLQVRLEAQIHRCRQRPEERPVGDDEAVGRDQVRHQEPPILVRPAGPDMVATGHRDLDIGEPVAARVDDRPRERCRLRLCKL